ncbi:MAG: TspO/MBR family protein [Flavisolibacter sp.]
MKEKRPVAAIFNILVFAFVVVMNTLAVTLPLNNKTTGELSDQYPNYFTPAGFTFSIWGIIYLLLFGFIVYQAVVLFSGKGAAAKVSRITPLFILNGLLNGAWIFAWHYEQVTVSLFIMLGLLITLIAIHNRLGLSLPWQPFSEKIFLDIPFSIYLGWISIATIANVAVWFTNEGIKPLNIAEVTWTIIMIIVGTLLALLMLWLRRNLFYSLVPAWAFYGIMSKRLAAGDSGSLHIATVAQVCMYVILAAVVVFSLLQATPSRTARAKS